ncbi:MAG: cytochrome-c peroxidase [Gemmataceae bacterium]
MCCRLKALLGGGLLAALLAGGLATGLYAQGEKKGKTAKAEEKVIDDGLADAEFALPNHSWMTPFKDVQPIYFVNQNMPEWAKLDKFWTDADEPAISPEGEKITRKVVKLRVPRGLTANPPVPAENPMTVAKWALGRKLYFDPVLSADKTVSCASCHDPKKGFTDQANFSTGIRGNKGGMSAPTVFNSGYNALQFWDGRAASLEDQSQGPVQNALEMFDGDGHAWKRAVKRLREDAEYVAAFKAVFGTPPTRDSVAKAIATYERTVLSGNSIQDRAEAAARDRFSASGTGDVNPRAGDYSRVLKEAVAAKDAPALKALKLDPDADADQVPAVAKRLASGRAVFFGKARCNGCHVGDNWTDNAFHNLGVGAKDGKLPASAAGRYASQPTGHKNPDLFGAFKTPTLRHLLGTAPYLHDGSEKDLEAVVEFYDRGGNPNEYLDIRMRDEDAERAWRVAAAAGKKYEGPEAFVYGGKPVVPLKLKLTPDEKRDLVLFLRALQGDPADPLIDAPAPAK